VKGLLADVNNVKQVRVLLMLLDEEPRGEFWHHLDLTTPTFADLGLNPRSLDTDVWLKCQAEELVLITTNRNDDGPDSLEATIRAHGTPQSLPVFTLADANRVLSERSYAELVADRLLEYLYDMDNLRGVGRLYMVHPVNASAGLEKGGHASHS
jgi:hypothetical protein